MRAHVVEIMNLVDKMLLGHMPFVGISYQNREKDEMYRQRFFEVNETRRVIEAAIKMGVQRFATATLGSSPLSPTHLEALRLMIEKGYDIELLPCIEIPIRLAGNKINDFRRWATYVEFERQHHSQARQRIISDPILNFRENWELRLSASKPYKDEDFRKLTVDWDEIDRNLNYFAELPVGYTEFGSETDFLTMIGRFDLLGELVDKAKSFGLRDVLFGIHHAGVTIPLLNDTLGGFHGYVTPLNPLGVMMFPTKLSAENAVRNAEKAVFAIKPLAGGRVKPKKAFAYVFDFDVEGCMLGVGSVAELREDINVCLNIWEDASQKV